MAMVNEIPFEDNEYLFVKCQSQIKKVIRVNHFSADSSSRSKMITEKIESILLPKKPFSFVLLLQLLILTLHTF